MSNKTPDQKAGRKVTRGRRWVRRSAMVLATSMFLLVPAGAASAFDICGSKDPVSPSMPGSVSSFLDPGPAAHTSPSIATDGTGGFVYERYGYPPPANGWDLGCANIDPSSSMDLMLGNWGTGFATTLVALSNATHRFATGAGWLGYFDALVQSISEKVSSSMYMPFVGVALAALGIFLIYEARKKRLAPVVQHVAWALLVMTLAATVMSWPLLASQTVDEVTATTVGQVNSQMLGENPNDADPAAARESLVVDHVLYQNWLRSYFGANSGLAAKDGPKLLDALTYSRDEVAQIKRDPAAAKEIDDTKAGEFKDVVKDVGESKSQTYRLFQGRGGNHLSTGILAIIAAICVLPFLIMADLLIVISLLVVRLAVMAFPAIAVVGVTPWGKPMVKRLGSLVGGAAFNAVVFSLGAAIDVLLVSAILGPDSMLLDWVGLFLCLLLGGVLWHLLKPHRQLAATFGKTARKQSKGLVKRGTELYVGAELAGKVAGKSEAREEEAIEAERSAEAPRPESFTRPARDVLSDRPARISPEDPAMRYRFPHAPVERVQAVPVPDEDGRYVYPHDEAEDIYRPVPNVLVSREPRGEPVDVYTPPAREPVPAAVAEPSYARIDVPLITRPKPHEESE
jgi:hypothetical protein